MKKYLFVFLSVCSLSATMFAVEPAVKVVEYKGTYEEVEQAISPLQLEVTQGWRQDHFKVSGRSSGVPFKHNHSLSYVKVYETRVRMQSGAENWFCRLDGGYGKIMKSGSGFSLFGSRVDHKSSKGVQGGHAWDLKASVGRECFCSEGLGFFDETVSFTPIAGYIGGVEKVKASKDKYTSFRCNAPFIGVGFKKEFYDYCSVYAEYDLAFCLPKGGSGIGNIGTLGLGFGITEYLTFKAEVEVSTMKVHYDSRHKHHSTGHARRVSAAGRLSLNLAV